MRDLFGSTSFIRFRTLETILSSSDAVTKLLNFESNKELFEEDYTIEDYLSNIDSYLYGLVIFPSLDNVNLREWIKNYIMYLYVPLIEKDSKYIIKSKLIGEIFKIKYKKSRINESISQYILSDILVYLENLVLDREDEVINILDSIQDDEMFLDYLENYYSIYNNKEYIKDVYIKNDSLKEELMNSYEFLK